MAAVTLNTSADDSVQIVLIGSTGSGKSSTGNTILGKKHFSSAASGKSVTLECKHATEEINGRKVTVVDTPGWDCTELPKHVVVSQIQNALQNLQGPFSFLLVLCIGSVESDDIKKIQRLEEILGPSFLDHTTILFSHRDNLEWKMFKNFIAEGGAEFQALLSCCNYRYYSWNNRDARSDEDVEKVLKNLKETERKDKYSAQCPQDIKSTNKIEALSEQKGCTGKGLGGPDMGGMDTKQSKRIIRVLFLGKSKVGKTSSIRTLQGKCEQTDDKEVYTYRRAGLNLQFTDSPGFDENPREIQKIISESVATTEPHVILIVMGVDRFSPATKRTMQHVQDVLGQKATKHTMILFTGKDDLDGKPIERFIEENVDVKTVVDMNGMRFHALNNRDASDHGQVEELLLKIDSIYTANKGEFYKLNDKYSDPRQEKGKESGGIKWNFWKFNWKE